MGKNMETVYNLEGATSIGIEENVDRWWVNGYEGDGGYVHRARAEFRKDREEMAHALAREWCQKIGVSIYVCTTFTATPYLFKLTLYDLDENVIEKHTENWGL